MSITTVRGSRGAVYRVRLMTDGKSICRSFKSKIDALLYEKDILLSNGDVSTKTYTLQEAANEWLEVHAVVRKAGSSVITDRNMLKNNILPSLGGMQIHKIKDFHINYLILELKRRKAPLSDSTINRNLCVLKTIFNYFKNRHVIFTSPMDGVKNFKIDTKGFKYWNLKDAKTFLEYTKKKYSANGRYSTHTGRYSTYLFYLVALNTGMRLGELIALRWRNVDFENRIITVAQTYSGHERKVKDTTKSRKIRHVPLNSSIYNELQQASANRKASDLVFHWNGSFIDPHNLRSRCFEKDIKESGVEEIRLHDLRHSYASHFMMNGGNPYDLQKILGHSSLRMTEIYTHLSSAHLASKGDIVSFSAEDNIVYAKFGTTG